MATRDDIIANVQINLAAAGVANASKKDCGVALDAVLNAVATTAMEGESVRTVIGTFRKRHSDAREGRNPKTGETVHISARDALAFRPSAALVVVEGEKVAKKATAKAAPAKKATVVAKAAPKKAVKKVVKK